MNVWVCDLRLFCLQVEVKGEYLNVAKISDGVKKLRKNWTSSWAVLSSDRLLLYKDSKQEVLSSLVREHATSCSAFHTSNITASLTSDESITVWNESTQQDAFLMFWARSDLFLHKVQTFLVSFGSIFSSLFILKKWSLTESQTDRFH